MKNMDVSRKQTIYTCPMHPEIEKDSPGLCSECGMNLVESRKSKDESQKPGGHQGMHHGHEGHHEHGSKFPYAKAAVDKHAGHSISTFMLKFWVSLALTIPVVAYSELPKRLFDWSAPVFPGSEYLAPALSSIVFFYGGWIFIVGAMRELQAKLPGMMTLIALAISAAYLYSVYTVLRGEAHTLFWELTTLITVMLLGHWIEMRAVQGARGALRELSKLLPDTAEVLLNGKTQEIPLDQLRAGDIVLVRPGGRIPADGVVVEGESQVNESLITGESKPVSKEKGEEVIAGSMNGDGALKIMVSKIGKETFLAGIMRLVADAEASKSRLQLLSDRAAYYLTIIAVAGGVLTFAVWQFAGFGFPFALERLIAVLVIACPHALGLAIPLVASISTTMAARNGFLVRERRALEAAREIGVVVFDKTGTLTKGEYGITNIWPIGAAGENEVLQLAASVDAHSEHFIARAIVSAVRDRKLKRLEVANFSRIPGKGVRGDVEGVAVSVGSAALAEGLSVPDAIHRQIIEENKKGKTIIYVVASQKVAGAMALADVIRDESREAVSALKRMGVKVTMLTGDAEPVAKWVAEDLGIDEYFAKVLPDKKSNAIRLLQERGLKVAMVGDGINDAPALTQADLGIAIGAGTNVAVESAGIVLVRNDPRDIPKIIRLSRLTYAKMIQNLFWASGYNLIALPLAAGILFSYGIILQPAVSAVFMSLSTVIVAANALLLRRSILT